MASDAQLAHLAARVGVLPEYTDMQRVVHTTTPDTQRSLIRASGIAADTLAEVRESLAALTESDRRSVVPQDVVVQSGHCHRLSIGRSARWVLRSETGQDVLAEGQAEDTIDLPALASGIYALDLNGTDVQQQATLIAAPKRVPDLLGLTGQSRIWGVMVALYALRSNPDQTLGNYRDLADIAEIFGQAGAAFLGLNPVHALGWAATETISPYSPSHRGFLNTDHIAVSGQQTRPAGKPSALLDYDAHRVSHRPALESGYAEFLAKNSPGAHAAFSEFCAEAGAALEEFAGFECLSARFGPDSRMWPDAAWRDPIQSPDQLGFHKWLQWQADLQLAQAQSRAKDAGMALGLYLDLAVGARLGGAESWGHTAASALGVSLGAPPDHLSPAGQTWQLAPLSPQKLTASRYAAFRYVLQRTMRHCGLLRIDHALGLSRSFWIPEDGTPGGYMRMPLKSLMAIIAIEAERAGTAVIGEDLGLVPKGFRSEMEHNGLYGYSVFQFEKDGAGNFLPMERLRPQSLACFGTHDTPTLSGFWQGIDIAWWQKLGWITEAQAARATDRRAGEKRQLAGVKAPRPLPRLASDGVRDSVHAALGRAPAALVAVQLDDILGVEEAQNLPGTIDEHPNWRRRCPVSVPDLKTHPGLEKASQLMAQAGRSSKTRKDTA